MSAQVFLACQNCGTPMPVDEEMVKNSLAISGTMPTVAHDACPGTEVDETDAPVLRKFRAQVVLMELTGDADDVDVTITATHHGVEVLAGVGHTVEAETFARAVNGPFTAWLNDTWPKMMESAAFADLPDPTPATGD